MDSSPEVKTTGNTVEKTPLCLYELVDGSYVVGKAKISYVNRVSQPLRLIPQQVQGGGVRLALMPMIPFLSKEKQTVESIEILAKDLRFRFIFGEHIKAPDIEEAYHQHFSSIVVASSLEAANIGNGKPIVR